MSKRIVKRLVCDRCGYSLQELLQRKSKEFGDIGGMTIGWQRVVAKNHGWRVRINRDMDYCNRCWPDVFKQSLKPSCLQT